MSEDLSTRKSPVPAILLGTTGGVGSYLATQKVDKVKEWVTDSAKTWDDLVKEAKDTTSFSTKVEALEGEEATAAKDMSKEIADRNKLYEDFIADENNKYKFEQTAEDAEKVKTAQTNLANAEQNVVEKRQQYINEEAAKLRQQEIVQQAKKAGTTTNPEKIEGIAKKLTSVAQNYHKAKDAHEAQEKLFNDAIENIAKINEKNTTMTNEGIDKLINEYIKFINGDTFNTKEEYETAKKHIEELQKSGDKQNKKEIKDFKLKEKRYKESLRINNLREEITRIENLKKQGISITPETEKKLIANKAEIEKFDSQIKEFRKNVEEAVTNRRILADYGIVDVTDADKEALDKFFNKEANLKKETRSAKNLYEMFLKTPSSENANKLHNLVIMKKANITEMQDIVKAVDKMVEESKPKFDTQSVIKDTKGKVKQTVTTGRFTKELSFDEALKELTNKDKTVKDKLIALFGKDANVTRDSLTSAITETAEKIGVTIDPKTSKIVSGPNSLEAILNKYNRPKNIPDLRTSVNLPKTAKLIDAEKAMQRIALPNSNQAVKLSEEEIMAKAKETAEGKLGSEKSLVEEMKAKLAEATKAGSKKERTKDELVKLFEEKHGNESEFFNKLKGQYESKFKKLFEGEKNNWKVAGIVAAGTAIAALIGSLVTPRKEV